MHTTIQVTPTEAFNLNPNNEKDTDLILKIRMNTKKALERKVSTLIFVVDEKILLYRGVEKSKNDYLRITTSKKKIVNGYVIPATVVKVESNHLLIKIHEKSSIVKSDLQAGEEFKVTLNLIQKASDKRWECALTKK